MEETTSLFKRENLDDIYKIYKVRKVLILLDPYDSNYGFFLNLFSSFKDEFIKYDLIVLHYRELGFKNDYEKVKKLIEEGNYSYYIGSQIGGSYLLNILHNKRSEDPLYFLFNPLFDYKEVDDVFKKYYSKRLYNDEDLVFLSSFIKNKNEIIENDEVKKRYRHIENTDIVIDSNFIRKEDIKYLKDPTLYYVDIYKSEIRKDEKLLSNILLKLKDRIYHNTMFKDELEEARSVIGYWFQRNKNWKKDWFPFILYDNHCDPDFLYRLIYHKLCLMRDSYLDKSFCPVESRRIKFYKQLNIAANLMRGLADDSGQIDIAHSIPIEELIMIYYKKTDILLELVAIDKDGNYYASFLDDKLPPLKKEEMLKEINSRYASKTFFRIETRTNKELDTKEVMDNFVWKYDYSKILKIAFSYLVKYSSNWSNW